MSGHRKRFGLCGHRGYGQSCHRCAMADKLDELVKLGVQLVTDKKAKKPKVWTKEEMTEEAKRLRRRDKS